MSQKIVERRKKLAALLRESDWDCVLLCDRSSLGYFTGAFEDPHERFFVLAIHADGREEAIAPALSENQFRRHGFEALRTWKDGEDFAEMFADLAEEFHLRTSVIGVESSMRADHLLTIQEALPAAKIYAAGELVSRLRSVKDEAEIAALKKAGQVVDEVYQEVKTAIRPGMSELQLEAVIRAAIQARSAQATFCIIAAGANSAEPHHGSDDTIIQPDQVLLMDFGCEWEGYQADITRVVFLGKAPEEVKAHYRLVHSAYTAGLAAVKPGALASSVDQATREVIEAAGFGKYFVHRTGHGIGLNGHESPNISTANTMPLVPGNCFSIEPGVYFAGKYGIRLENIVACGIAGDDSVSLNEAISPEILEI